MANYIDIDGKKHVQLDDGSFVPAVAVLSVDGGFPIKLSTAQIDSIRSISFPATYPLPAAQVADLKQVTVSNFPSSFTVSNFPSSFTISNLPATYPLPADQYAKLQTLSDSVSAWSKGSGTIDGNTLRVTIASNQSTLSVSPRRCSSGVISSVPASVTAVTLASADSGRLFCAIYNESWATLYIGIGFTPTASSYTIQLKQDGYFEIPESAAGLAISGIWSSAAGSAKVTRGN